MSQKHRDNSDPLDLHRRFPPYKLTTESFFLNSNFFTCFHSPTRLAIGTTHAWGILSVRITRDWMYHFIDGLVGFVWVFWMYLFLLYLIGVRSVSLGLVGSLAARTALEVIR